MIPWKHKRIELTFTERLLATKPKKAQIFSDYIATKKPEEEIAADGGDEALKEEIRMAKIAEEYKAAQDASTIFYIMEDGKGTPYIDAYMIKGTFKEGLKAIKMMQGTESSKVTNNKQMADLCMFFTAPGFNPKSQDFNKGRIVLQLEEAYKESLIKKFREEKERLSKSDKKEDKEKLALMGEGDRLLLDTFERPLRAETMQGPRVALTKSEFVPAGTKAVFELWYPPLAAPKEGSKKQKVDIEEIISEILDYGAFHGVGQWRNAGYGTYTFKILEES